MAKKKNIGSVSFFNSRFTSVISIALVLFLLGLILLISLVGNKLSIYVKENISFSIVLKDNEKEADIKKMQKSLDTLPFIKSTEYISKEQALKELEEELGENPETFLGFNPLQASIEVKLFSEYANPDSLALIENKIRSYTSVSDLQYRKDMMELVNDNIRKVGIILLSLAAILMIISFVLIANTIRLLIYSKRFLIHTMKLVGATPGFIRKPFIRYNLFSGIMAAILAILMLMGALYYLQQEMAGFIQVIDTDTLLIVFGAVFVLGILLSVTATFFAVNKYLRMDFDKLYYI
ncbi:MAG: permease-like cell division protein FtsX [Tannerellaceae bacterium]|nr:permease-like cell division protein FtsX [Tannerellaceae bacterium]